MSVVNIGMFYLQTDAKLKTEPRKWKRFNGNLWNHYSRAWEPITRTTRIWTLNWWFSWPTCGLSLSSTNKRCLISWLNTTQFPSLLASTNPLCQIKSLNCDGQGKEDHCTADVQIVLHCPVQWQNASSATSTEVCIYICRNQLCKSLQKSQLNKTFTNAMTSPKEPKTWFPDRKHETLTLVTSAKKKSLSDTRPIK